MTEPSEQLRQAEVSRDAYRDERDQTQRERDEARASVEHLRGDYRRIRKDRDRLLLAWRSARRRANAWRAAATTEIPRWDEDAVVRRFGFLQPDQCGKCGEVNPRLTEALWLHAEAVWQRDQLRVEADHQWTVRRQMGHRVIDADSELTEAVDLARWLLAEMAWQQDVYRQAWARAEVDASIVAAEHQKWAAAIAETAVRLSDAGYHGQLVDSVGRLITERDADRDSRFRWAEETAALQAKLDLPCGSCHPCVNWDAGSAPEDAEEALTAALEAHQSAIVTMDDAGPEFDAQYAAHLALNLVRSWRPATVEAAPPAGIALADELWPTVAPVERVEWCVFYGGTDPYHRSACIELYDDEDDAIEHVRFYVRPAGVAKRSVRRGLWEVTQAAGVSGTGTEASDGE